MAKKVSDSQVAGIKAHAEAKNKETIDKVSKAIDKLKRKNKPINFETVCKEAGVSRATLYNNAQLKERILSLRAISKASPLDDVVAVKKDKIPKDLKNRFSLALWQLALSDVSVLDLLRIGLYFWLFSLLPKSVIRVV